MVPWCSGYHYCTTSFNWAWTQVLRRFKPYLWHVRDPWWWGSLIMVPAGNKAKCLSLVNHTTKTIHHHHQWFCEISWSFHITICKDHNLQESRFIFKFLNFLMWFINWDTVVSILNIKFSHIHIWPYELYNCG